MQTEHRRTQLLRAVIFHYMTSFNAPHNNGNNLQYATTATYKWSSSWLSTTERCCCNVGFPNVSLTTSHSRPRCSPLIPQHLWWFPWWLCLASSLWVKCFASLALGKQQLLLLPRSFFLWGFWESLSLHSSDWHWDQSAGCQTGSWCQDVPGFPKLARAEQSRTEDYSPSLLLHVFMGFT